MAFPPYNRPVKPELSVFLRKTTWQRVCCRFVPAADEEVGERPCPEHDVSEESCLSGSLQAAGDLFMAHRVPNLPPHRLAAHGIPIVPAPANSLQGYGRIVDDFATAEIEIVRWPAQGRRPVDADSGDQGGTTEGAFSFEWKGDVLYGRNDAVRGSYLLGWCCDPALASETN